MDFMLNRDVPTLSAFITWAVMIGMAVILTLCTMQVRMMEPKKKLPIRRTSHVSKRNLKIVGR